MNSHIPFQIPLSVGLRDDARFENFSAQGNELVCATLKAASAGEGEQFLFIWGSAGVGCTHLLQAACHEAPLYQRQAAYLPLDELRLFGPESLVGMEHVNLVCVDNLQAVAGDARWEEALFHFFNRVRQNNNNLIIAGNGAPRQLAIDLPDLSSRMSWGIVFQVHALDDEFKAELLIKRAAARGIELGEDVTKYLLSHASRDMSDLFRLLDKLDQASLSAKRKVTIPFVKEVTGF
ncbi:MAG: DnaA regulatory inactivator Hda [Pontibacterium sp.]